MVPYPQSLLQSLVRTLQPLRLVALVPALALVVPCGQALAQDMSPPAPADQASQSDEPVAFEADRVEYASDDEIVTAIGNVLLTRDEQSVRADKVTWNRKTGIIVATGNVRLVDADGNKLYTERVELTDKLKTGAMANMLLALREGGRLAARSGVRDENGNVILEDAAYTGCAVEGHDGCPKRPTWRITARKVVYDQSRKIVSFKGARIVFFGKVALPIPGLKTTTDGRAMSGLLIPDFKSTPSNGVEVHASYYLRLSDNRDLTATAYAYTSAAPMGSLQYRALTEDGAYQITGYATSSQPITTQGIPVGNRNGNNFRGYIGANGRFQLSPEWSVSGSLRRATDRTFLRRYDISQDDRLRSTIDVERVGQNSYFSISGWTTQTMVIGADQGQVPVALPIIDYRRRLNDPVLGGTIKLQVNSLAIQRNSGEDSQRAFASAQWDLRRVTPMGQVVTLTGLVRGDVYHSTDNALNPATIYQGLPGWQSRGIALAALDVQWPLVGAALGGTQVFTPHIQLVAAPPIRNLAVPNEDARAVELEDSNLFALNRFPGYDRVEDGVRFTYGFDWRLDRPNWRVRTTVGQSVRLTGSSNFIPQGTGLASTLSDFVGRTEVRYRDFIELVHRFRLDKSTLAFRRNEIDAVIGNHRTYMELGYVKLARNIPATIEALPDSEEARASARVAFANYWSIFGSAVVSISDKNATPALGSTGFQPLRTRIGASYQDDCLEIDLTWRRDYITTGDAKRGNSIQFRFILRNIGSQ